MLRVSPVSRLSLVGAVLMTALIGWRVSIDEADHRAAVPKPLQARSFEPGSHHRGRVGDEGLLVPAVYALDPQVRIVYDRPVNRWM